MFFLHGWAFRGNGMDGTESFESSLGHLWRHLSFSLGHVTWMDAGKRMSCGWMIERLMMIDHLALFSAEEKLFCDDEQIERCYKRKAIQIIARTQLTFL
jgi:hypothetical protein